MNVLTTLAECFFTGLVAGAVIIVAARIGLIPILVMWEDENEVPK